MLLKMIHTARQMGNLAVPKPAGCVVFSPWMKIADDFLWAKERGSHGDWITAALTKKCRKLMFGLLGGDRWRESRSWQSRNTWSQQLTSTRALVAPPPL